MVATALAQRPHRCAAQRQGMSETEAVLSERDIDAWAKDAFDHPVTYPAWHWSDDAQDFPDSEHTLRMMTAVYSNPERFLGHYSDAQLNQGLNMLASNACSNASFSFSNRCIALELRCVGLRAIGNLFELLFAKRCSRTLDEWDAPGASPLDSVCYMWWDIFPFVGGSSAVEETRICLSIMEQSLASPSEVCQYSALHGLGHWFYGTPEMTVPLLDRYMQTHPSLHPRLRAYAALARVGEVQ